MATHELIFLAVAIAFVVLVIFLAFLACTACRTLKNIQETVRAVQRQIDSLDAEPKTLIHNMNEISADLLHKMKKLDPLFYTVFHIGEGLEYKAALEKERLCLRLREKSKQSESEDNTAAQTIEWALLGFNLWKKYKQRREEHVR